VTVRDRFCEYCRLPSFKRVLSYGLPFCQELGPFRSTLAVSCRGLETRRVRHNRGCNCQSCDFVAVSSQAEHFSSKCGYPTIRLQLSRTACLSRSKPGTGWYSKLVQFGALFLKVAEVVSNCNVWNGPKGWEPFVNITTKSTKAPVVTPQYHFTPHGTTTVSPQQFIVAASELSGGVPSV
jgi:hypothetical protein